MDIPTFRQAGRHTGGQTYKCQTKSDQKNFCHANMIRYAFYVINFHVYSSFIIIAQNYLNGLFS